MSYHFRDRRRFPSKIANFSHPPCILRHAEGVLLGIGYRRWGQKIRTMGLPGPAPKFDDILCCLGTMHHRDRRTDRHRATAKTALSVRGKNYNNRISIGHHDVCATARDTRHTTPEHTTHGPTWRIVCCVFCIQKQWMCCIGLNSLVPSSEQRASKQAFYLPRRHAKC